MNNIAKLAVAVFGWTLLSTAYAQHPWNAGFTNSSVVTIAGTERKSSPAYGSLGDTGGHTYTVQTRATGGGWVSPRPNDPQPYISGQGTPNPWYHTGNFYFYKGGQGTYANPDVADMNDPAWQNHRSVFNHSSTYNPITETITTQVDITSGSPILDNRSYEFEHYHSPSDTGADDNLAEYVEGDVLPRIVEQQKIHIPSPNTGLETWTSDSVSLVSLGVPIPSISKLITGVTDYFPQIRSGTGSTLVGSELHSLIVSKRSFHVYVRSYDVGYISARPQNYPSNLDWTPTWVELGRLYLFEYKQDYYHEKFPYQIRKDLAGAQSIDSRRTYGQPDVAGQFPAVDPNAPARNITFKDWIYRGGLFVGQMNPDSNDLSGAARIQIYPSEGPNSNTEIATLSLLHLGSAPGTWPEFATLTSIVGSSDANLNVPLTQLTWANKWTTTSGSVELLLDAATPNDDYVNWPASILPSSPRMIVQHKNENLDTPPANSGWHYFASAARLTGETSYPLIDGHPRVWYVDRQTPVRWVQP